MLIRGEVLDDLVFDTWKFCQNYKYSKIVWLLLIALDKVGKEKDELRGLIFQIKHNMNDLKISQSVLKIIVSFWSCRAEFTENQTQSFNL